LRLAKLFEGDRCGFGIHSFVVQLCSANSPLCTITRHRHDKEEAKMREETILQNKKVDKDAEAERERERKLNADIHITIARVRKQQVEAAKSAGKLPKGVFVDRR